MPRVQVISNAAVAVWPNWQEGMQVPPLGVGEGQLVWE